MHGTGVTSKKTSFEVALKSKQQIAEDTWAFIFEKPSGFKFFQQPHFLHTTCRDANYRSFQVKALDSLYAIKEKITCHSFLI